MRLVTSLFLSMINCGVEEHAGVGNAVKNNELLII